MLSGFVLPEDPEYTIHDSAADSARFAHFCLESTAHGRWRAASSFVDVEGAPQHWHGFGDLEGPGWAANAVGGAYQLYAWGRYDHCSILERVGLGLLDHVLHDGFVQDGGFIVGYRDTARNRFCLNFKHTDDWLCPGSMAKMALQMLWAADTIAPDDVHTPKLRDAAARAAEWLLRSVQLVDGWIPRRCTPDGTPYPKSAEGGDDPCFASSADGLYVPWLLAELTSRGLADHRARLRELVDVVVGRGGITGSINHDTYDADENVAHAEEYRLLRRAARVLDDPKLLEFGLERALPGLDRFRMAEDRNGVATRGLFYMEDTWDTAYLWENAEIALAYLEAYADTGERAYACRAVTTLRAVARHHHGPHGFLTEGVDWNNHVGREHHIDGAEFGAIRYTEPLLNNLHHVEAALSFLRTMGRSDC